MATPINSKVYNKLVQHAGTKNPKKIIQHFNEDEAREGEDARLGLTGIRRWQKEHADFLRNKDFDVVAETDKTIGNIKNIMGGDELDQLAKSMDHSSDDAGQIAKERKYTELLKKKLGDKGFRDLMNRSSKSGADLSSEEMDMLKNTGDWRRGTEFDAPKSIGQKVKSVSVQRGKEKPVTVTEKEVSTPVSKFELPASYKTMRERMAEMDSGEAIDDYDSNPLLEGAIDASAIMGLRGLGKAKDGLIGRLKNLGSKKSLPVEEAEEAATKFFNTTGIPSMSKEVQDWSKPDKQMVIDTIKKMQSRYGKAAQAGDSEAVKEVRKKLIGLSKMKD